MDVVFHLAADHGGRGYVDLHQAACATNLALDSMVFLACYRAQVEKAVYASSGCVYPNDRGCGALARHPRWLTERSEETAIQSERERASAARVAR
jgi:nucleoside-diphosphate-sugar epimerase